jgi:hypothetical protein
MENASWETIISGKDPFLVGFLPDDYEEGENIIAYDQNGNIIILDGKTEPIIPVIIISQNERLQTIPVSQRSNYLNNEEIPYYESSSLTYLNKGCLSLETRNSNENVQLRSAGFYYKIVKAKFNSQSAMRKYESWAKRRPEVYVNANTAYGKVYGHEFDNKGWYDGNEKTLNWIAFYHNGSKDTKPYHTFDWYEMDFLVPYLDNNERIETGWVTTSEIGGPFRVYATKSATGGSYDFSFWMHIYR